MTVLQRAAPRVCSHRRDTHLLHVRHLLLLSHLVMPDLPQKGSGALEDAEIRYALTLSKEIQQKVRGQSVCLDHFPASPQSVCLSAGEPPAQISQSANHNCLSCPVPADTFVSDYRNDFNRSIFFVQILIISAPSVYKIDTNRVGSSQSLFKSTLTFISDAKRKKLT